MTSGFSPSLPWFFFRDSARAKKPRQGGLEVMRRESEGGEEIIGPLLSPRPVYFFGDFSNFQIIFGYKHQSHLNESVHDMKY